MRGIIIIVTLLFLVVVAGDAAAQSAKSSLEDPAQAQRFNDISDKLVCQCGCQMILRVCNHFECPSALPMRAQIEAQIRAGATDETIIGGFVEEYGMVVMSTPPAEGVNLAAWVMPGFAVLVGLFVMSYLVMDWAAKKKVKKTAPVHTIDPEIASRIETELKSMEK